MITRCEIISPLLTLAGRSCIKAITGSCNKAIAKIEDFAEELRESEVIEICNSAGIITKDVHKILAEKLGKRNSAAHPSSVSIGQLQAEAFIDELVKNVVLKLVGAHDAIFFNRYPDRRPSVASVLAAR